MTRAEFESKVKRWEKTLENMLMEMAAITDESGLHVLSTASVNLCKPFAEAVEEIREYFETKRE